MPKNASSPFELAQTAIALCHLHNRAWPDDDWQRRALFRQAKTLLADAQHFLKEPQKDAVVNLLVRLGNANTETYVKARKPIPFDVLLRPDGKGQSSVSTSSKKHRTKVGTITTENGLSKAIRRYFSRSDAAQIIRAKAMAVNEWKHLLKAQKDAVQTRAKKRVKGGDSEKS